MKLVLISDTHEQHEKVTIPPCDILIHAGDLTMNGREDKTREAIQWLHDQPAKDVVVIAGNHDWLFQRHPRLVNEIIYSTRVHYLENCGIMLQGLKFWGSPWTPFFFDWAFNCHREFINKHWEKIPEDTDVLITHGPPKGILDQAYPEKDSEHVGDAALRSAVEYVQPRFHVFGHIHGGAGTVSRVKFGSNVTLMTEFFNASVVNEEYRVVNKPWEVNL